MRDKRSVDGAMSGVDYVFHATALKQVPSCEFFPTQTVRTKAPAATLDVLVNALKELYHTDTQVKVIGTRHGEKLYETLITREEMAKAEDMGITSVFLVIHVI